MVVIPKQVIELGQGVFVADSSKKRGADEELEDKVQTKKKPKHSTDKNVCRHRSAVSKSVSKDEIKTRKVTPLSKHLTEENTDKIPTLTKPLEEKPTKASRSIKPKTSTTRHRLLKKLNHGRRFGARPTVKSSCKVAKADTMDEARQIKVTDHANDDADPIKRRQEIEQKERIQKEEKGRIEAGVRAAKATARTREGTKLKAQRERQRIALQKMEEAAERERESGLSVEIELEKLSRLNRTSPRILEKLGLFLKEDRCLELEEIESAPFDVLVDLEEGEII